MRQSTWIRVGIVVLLVVALTAYYLATGDAAVAGLPAMLVMVVVTLLVVGVAASGWLRAMWIALTLRREADSEPQRRRLQRLLAARARGVLTIDEVRDQWRDDGA